MTHQSETHAYDKPLPQIDPLTKGYWKYAKAHRLSVQHCRTCGGRHFPPGPVCPSCLSDDQEWEPVSGQGTLVSWGRFHRAYWPGFADTLPYNVCLVRLAEGPLIVSNLIGSAKDGPEIGMALSAEFDDVTDEISLVRFKNA